MPIFESFVSLPLKEQEKFLSTLSSRKIQKKVKPNIQQIYDNSNLNQYKQYEIRPLESFPIRFKTHDYHNLIKLQYNLIKHLYVKYKVPEFFYNLFSFFPDEINHQLFESWFFILAQGGSFQKAAKEYLTKKECVIFLNLKNNETISSNIWRARLLAANIDSEFVEKLINKQMFHEHIFFNEKYRDLINFFSKYHQQINTDELGELSDFIWAHLQIPNFSFAGRTKNSMINLSNVWHLEVQNAKYVKADWEIRFKPFLVELKKYNQIWEIIELKNSELLVDEGNVNHHCVASYIDKCLKGKCRILSLRNYTDNLKEITSKRITIEVRNDKILQIRGKYNRPANDEEMKIIKKFADKEELIIDSYC